MILRQCFVFGQWTYYCDDYRLVHEHGDTVQLEPRLGRLLELFCQRPGETLSRDFLIDEIWAPRVVSEESLTVAISQLRRHLREGKGPGYIKTVPGQGYAWKISTQRLHDTATSKPPRSTWRKGITASAAFLVVVVVSIILWPSAKLDHQAGTQLAHYETLNRASLLVASGNDREIDEAIRLYRDILSEEPNAQAYYGMAKAKLTRISPHEIPIHADELISLIERALAEDAQLPEAEWLLGMIYFYGRWDFATAKELLVGEFNRDNRSPRFLLQFSEVMLALGESTWVERAIRELRRHHPEYYAAPMLAWLHLLLGDTERAQLEISRILAVEPASAEILVSAQHVAYQAGHDDLAWQYLAELLQFAKVAEDIQMELQQHYEKGGLPSVHEALMQNPLTPELGHYRPPMATARHAIVAGHNDLAIAAIRQAIAERQWEVLWLLVDPHYEPLYVHPEFIDVATHFQQLTGQN
ncbi:MAG: winged helix-turn-helix domain-containing protein [Aliidiomarina sp.]|uniref:winged helix-turn-helix domain-containing protein n=1 Tax=Aliidiomarina sp. TaxID=1872439 RepID=UPI0025C25EAB|nr:winged helix-turn-helix domain-containing protein [Aliidiomarina sp.]MCH8500733.1 winged helix-turn-helix domain-containing protein [Aliidiomarina sp.]